MTTTITHQEAIECASLVTPYRWLKRNLTVTRQGQCGMFDIMFVKEPGFCDTPVADVRVFSEVPECQSE